MAFALCKFVLGFGIVVLSLDQFLDAFDANGAVFVLGALILYFQANAGGLVNDVDGGAGFVDLLAAGAGGSSGLKLKLIGINLQSFALLNGLDGDEPTVSFVFGAEEASAHPLNGAGPGFEEVIGFVALNFEQDGFIETRLVAGQLLDGFDFEVFFFAFADQNIGDLADDPATFLGAGAGGDLN